MQHPQPHLPPHPPAHRRRRVLLSATTAAVALVAAGLTALSPSTAEAATARQVEKLDRGVVSVHTDAGNLVSWRWLGTDPNDVSFNVYRAGTKVNSTPVTGSTNYFHSGAPAQADYTVRAIVGGVEQSDSVHAVQLRTGYTDVPISPPAGGTTPDGVAYTYEANDASVADLDGDGSPGLRPQVAAHQRQGQLPVRLHRQHDPADVLRRHRRAGLGGLRVPGLGNALAVGEGPAE